MMVAVDLAFAILGNQIGRDTTPTPRVDLMNMRSDKCLHVFVWDFGRVVVVSSNQQNRIYE